MSSTLLEFASRTARSGGRGRTVPLTAMAEREIGVVVEVRAASNGRADRLLAMGVTPGARVTMLQRFPGIVFQCDQTELAVERAVADCILIHPLEQHV
jgi:Fe2+ transport system protein FeoA